ncbi:GGDEF domain-containing protein [Nitrosomonas ureae]|uniref:diguanylate cyclase n=1 Tax=Nitrosomonas ureae TaxID=44577 RepID=A0A0S3AFY1_9PROT|nr:GGDEF domain-containing protein [Nitrosomonas ureae]ALQ50076.1 diguanylate cyclase [Nitrosomonas ureae]SDT90119.1 diguanylate cyclase [Nitrosomonas ureae]SEQ35881.1 diguanylate cyclase [Nitrosomonas ureae]
MNQFANASPSVIARETLKQLAILKIQPTPESYFKLYNQIAGNPDSQVCAVTAKLLMELAKEFPRHTPPLLNCANNLELAVKDKSWSDFKSVLVKFVATVTASNKTVPPIETAKSIPGTSWVKIIDSLFDDLFDSENFSENVNKRKKIKYVLDEFSDDPELAYTKLIALVQSWKGSDSIYQESEESIENISIPVSDANFFKQQSEPKEDILAQEYQISGYTDQLLELLAQTLEQVIANQIEDKILAGEARSLGKQVKKIQSKLGMEQFMASFQRFCVKLELGNEDKSNIQQGLLKLLSMLMDSTSELLSEDQWIKLQVSKLKKTMSRPLDMQILAQAEFSLGKIIQRQIKVKQSLGKARETMRQMVTSLISNLEELSDATGGYHEKLEYYSERINHINNIDDINQLLADIMQDTQKVRNNVLKYRNDLVFARAEINEAQNQINQLETQLQEMSEQVQEDHLTGALNRRGFDKAFEREITQLARSQGTLCFALLDIDNFKQLNDTHGHHVGDDALKYLVEAVKETVRRDDVISRYGGEEFAILLPNSGLKAAISTVARIRRYLTKKFFLHGNNRLLITFSAGVAQYQPGESQENLFKRTDEALYFAKRNGKNQIVAAEEAVAADEICKSQNLDPVNTI